MTNQPDRELEWLREEAIKEGWYLVLAQRPTGKMGHVTLQTG